MPEHETVLWLIRHPEPAEFARGRCYGALDIPLSAHGERQAHSIASVFALEPPAAVYTSPLLRCTETARFISSACACRLEILDALWELNFGEFEGRPYGEIAAEYPDLYRQWMEHPTETRFPGGEDFAQMAERVLAAAHDLVASHRGEAIAFVAHGGPIRMLLADALGMQLSGIFRIAQRYGAMNRIRYSRGVPAMELMNGWPHRRERPRPLHGAAPPCRKETACHFGPSRPLCGITRPKAAQSATLPESCPRA